MSKNMTKKGLALGAGVALIASGLGVAPANAAGQDDKTFVSLSPRVGTEYSVLLDQYFDLKSNVIDSLAGTSGKDLKFLVTDPSSAVYVDQSQGTTDAVQNSITGIAYVDSGNVTTVTASGAAYGGASKHFVYGLTSTAAEGTGGTATKATDLNGLVFTQASGTTVTNATLDFGADDTSIAATGGKTEATVGLSSRTAILANGAIDNDLFESATITTSISGLTITNGRAADGSFVVNSETNANANDRLLRLVTDSATTYSVTVTAWVDSNDNGIIDSTEYTSPTRTVTFNKSSDLTFGYTFTPAVGDENLELVFTTTPVLNGQQVDAQDGSSVFGALFTRQDSTDANNYAADADSTWDDTNKQWTSKVSMDLATLAWTDLTQAVADTDVTETGSSVLSNVATIVSSGNHNLRVGDKVTIGGATDTDLNVEATVSEIVSATTFKIPTKDVADDADPIAGNLTYTVTTYSGNDAITDRVFPGVHTAQVYVGTTKLGAKQTATVGSSASASSLLEIAGSSTIQPASFDAAADSNDIEVKKGVTSVTMTVTVYDAAEKAVGAGRNVAVQLGNPNGLTKTGTFTLNGKAVTSTTLQTDAAGQVTITVGENDGDVAAQVRVTATPENVSGAATSVDLLWNDVTYALYDLNDASTSRQENRTLNKNGSLTFAFAVLDQWKSAPADGTYRLKIDAAGNTVSSAYHSVVGGRANVTVTDGQIGAGTSIDLDVTVEKDVSSVWTAQNSISWNSDGAALGDLAINIKDQTDKVVLDVDGSTIYGNDTADLGNNIAAKATVAQDRRTEIASQPAYGSNAVVVTGRVVNSVTNAVRPGAVVTLSGPSSVLFSEGGVDSFGSITVIADSSGEFGVDLFSNSAQKDSVITVSSNGVSSTVKVTFAAVGATAGTSLVIDAPASVNPGSTFMVKATLTDKYGNAVSTGTNDQLKVTYTGPGIVFGTLPDDTDVNGQISFAVLLGANDAGSASVVVSYDQSNDGDFTGTTLADADLTVSKSIVVGTAGNTGEVATWTKKLDASSAKIYAKNIVGAGKVQFMLNGEEIAWVRATSAADSKLRTANGASYLVRTVDLVEGQKNVLEIYVDGVRTARTAYTY